MGEPERVKTEAGAVVFAVKAVPGARREEVAGWLGERLKVRVSQPAEGGKANRAICALLAAELDIPEAHIELVRGHTSPETLLRIRNLTPEAILARWP